MILLEGTRSWNEHPMLRIVIFCCLRLASLQTNDKMGICSYQSSIK